MVLSWSKVRCADFFLFQKEAQIGNCAKSAAIAMRYSFVQLCVFRIMFYSILASTHLADKRTNAQPCASASCVKSEPINALNLEVEAF